MVMIPKLPNPPAPEHAHSYYVGEIAAASAYLEHIVADTLWRLMKINERVGACLTANMPLNARLAAMISLAHLRGIDKPLIKKLTEFRNISYEVSELRNRAIHDMWFGAMLGDGTIIPHQQLRVTAAGKEPKFITETVSADELKSILDRILAHLNRFWELRGALMKQFQASQTRSELPSSKQQE